MRTLRQSLLAVVLAVLSVASGCNRREQTRDRGVDLVNRITPVSRDMAGVRVTVEALRSMTPQARLARLRQDYPRLEESLMYFLRQNGKTGQGQNAQRVEFRFGSMENVSAEDREGRLHRGYFENQLVARVHLENRGEPYDVLVECLNGLFSLPGDLNRLPVIYTAVPQQRFRIARREGLIHHVDPDLAVTLAERFDLPLYRGRRMRSQARITPAVAREMLPTTDRTQVTVRVYTGDEFDLVAMRYTPAERPRSQPKAR